MSILKSPFSFFENKARNYLWLPRLADLGLFKIKGAIYFLKLRFQEIIESVT